MICVMSFTYDHITYDDSEFVYLFNPYPIDDGIHTYIQHLKIMTHYAVEPDGSLNSLYLLKIISNNFFCFFAHIFR